MTLKRVRPDGTGREVVRVIDAVLPGTNGYLREILSAVHDLLRRAAIGDLGDPGYGFGGVRVVGVRAI